MKEIKYYFILAIIIIGIIITFLITTNSNTKEAIINKTDCQDLGYCSNLYYIKFSEMDNYHTFIIYKKNENGFLAVLNDTYLLTAFSTPTDCYQGGCNDGTEIFTSSNHNLGMILNHDFLNLLPNNYNQFLNFASWHVGNVTQNNTGNAYVGLVSYQDWKEMKDNPKFNQDINQAYWLSNSTDITPYRIYVVDNNEIIINAPNVSNAYARPVIEIKNNVNIISGDGSKENPFII